MALRKYIFFIDEKGISTYKYKKGSEYENLRYKGEKICRNTDMKIFLEWFWKTAAIASDDDFDLCFLSEKPMVDKLDESGVLHCSTEKKSSWRQDDIVKFCQKEIGESNYEIQFDEDNRFVCQISNIYNKSDVKTIYLKCYPEFVYENKKEVKDEKSDVSLLYQYYHARLDEI